MSRFLSALRNFFLKTADLSESDANSIRLQFQKRYQSFRTLLTANNNALHAMAELEKMYYGGDSYRMAEVRKKISAIFINVYKMIRNLREMSDGKHGELEKKFDTICNEIEQIVERKIPVKSGPYILSLTSVSRKTRDQTGDKMAVLGELSQLDFINIPCGFVITASATREYLTPELLHEINRKLQVLDPEDVKSLYATCDQIQEIVRKNPVPADLEEYIRWAYNSLSQKYQSPCRVAMRSSAIGEDTAGVSFAGLYLTLLNVEADDLITAYREVIAGKYSARAISYRRKRGFRHEDIEMSVGCLEMIDAAYSGVIYSMDPGNPLSDTFRINSAPGIARGVVDGTVTTDLFVLTRKKPYFYVTQHGVSAERLTFNGDRQKTPLTDEQITRLGDTALKLEEYFGAPQDIEWSIDQNGKLYILQSRSIVPSPPAEISHKQHHDCDAKLPAPFINDGICASAGVACGEIIRLEHHDTTYLFPRGAVLAVDYPLPDWASLLGRASAVLAQHGTEAGHLATVAREFGIPALFSVKDLMTHVENGQKVTVDSENKKVYLGCQEVILSRRKVKRDLMAGSPVQRILTECLQHITPLNLTDPAHIKFKASWCETLHDITRYCHEKSVAEMFHFSNINRLGLGQAKRLEGKTAMEWWVINLADGFRQEYDQKQKTVTMDDIESLPMLEIWKGITAYPWNGPPPISTRGFGSIIFQSAMRPELDPAVASGMTTKNYFLISRNFCNLSVRLGYHYAMIESYVGELLTESYITFRFKGGAADSRRKAMRARLLSEILTTFGFKVELRSDALLARVKKQPLDFLKSRLQILGYLTLHTRQLDMVMDRKQAVEQYKQKFTSEINAMISPGGQHNEKERTHSPR